MMAGDVDATIADEPLYATTRSGIDSFQLVSLDAPTSAAKPLGWVGYHSRLDAHPIDGQLYGASGSSAYRVDPLSGQKDYLGSLVNEAVAPISTTAITFDDDGKLYVADYADNLYKVDILLVHANS